MFFRSYVTMYLTWSVLPISHLLETQYRCTVSQYLQSGNWIDYKYVYVYCTARRTVHGSIITGRHRVMCRLIIETSNKYVGRNTIDRLSRLNGVWMYWAYYSHTRARRGSTCKRYSLKCTRLLDVLTLQYHCSEWLQPIGHLSTITTQH